jgi:ABC-type Co2+ transport system permease subunit
VTFVRICRTCLLVLVLALSACYPDLDWREVTSSDGGYKVLMPAKPEHAQRQVVIGGVSLEMSMDSTRRDGIAFGAAFFGGAAAMWAACIAAALLLSAYMPADLPADAPVMAVLLMLGFAEAMLTGMLATMMAVYKPRWIGTFSDERYLHRS